MTTATELREQADPFERLEKLDLLLETAHVLIETEMDIPSGPIWAVYIRPVSGGFPLVKGRSIDLSEAVKQAVELWETK